MTAADASALDAIAEPQRSALAIVAPGDFAANWTLVAHDDGTIEVPVLGRRLVAQRVSRQHLAGIASVLGLAAAGADVAPSEEPYASIEVEPDDRLELNCERGAAGRSPFRSPRTEAVGERLDGDLFTEVEHFGTRSTSKRAGSLETVSAVNGRYGENRYGGNLLHVVRQSSSATGRSRSRSASSDPSSSLASSTSPAAARWPSSSPGWRSIPPAGALTGVAMALWAERPILRQDPPHVPLGCPACHSASTRTAPRSTCRVMATFRSPLRLAVNRLGTLSGARIQ